MCHRATSMIGYEITKALLKKGYKLILISNNSSHLYNISRGYLPVVDINRKSPDFHQDSEIIGYDNNEYIEDLDIDLNDGTNEDIDNHMSNNDNTSDNHHLNVHIQSLSNQIILLSCDLTNPESCDLLIDYLKKESIIEKVL